MPCEQRYDPQQHDSPDDRSYEGAESTCRYPAEQRNEPAAQKAADKADDQVDQQSGAAAFKDQAGDPSGRQANELIP